MLSGNVQQVSGKEAACARFRSNDTGSRRMSSARRYGSIFRFTLSLRDAEELLAARGVDVTYETIRRASPKADSTWHLDEMAVRIRGRRMYMWRAVDREGEVLDMLVQKRRNKAATLKLLKKLLKNQDFVPERIVTDGLASCRAALKVLKCQSRHQQGRLRDNNRIENSQLPIRRRGRKMQRFKLQGQAQRFVSTDTAIYKVFNLQRHLISRKTLRTEPPPWQSGMLRPPKAHEFVIHGQNARWRS